MIRFARPLLFAAASLLAMATAVAAQPTAWSRPNVATAQGAVTVEFQGAKLVNHGLVGAGRLAASTRDFHGDTLGSFSAMAITDWRRLADGTYAGSLTTLPDRGPNGVGTIVGTSDYAGRLHRFSFTFAPHVGAGVAAPDQVTLTPTGGLLLKDAKGQTFTGLDPAEPAAAGRTSLDSEGLAIAADGGFYVSDEYAANIYRFDKTGALMGVIAPVAAVAPMSGGALTLTGAKAPDTGRRNNQGLEGVSIVPGGKRLAALLQSATVQDSAPGKDADQSRANTRLFLYDISKTATPAAPVAEYVVQLPVFRNKGDGAAPDKTAAQSEILALNDHQFLVLARDGNGRGNGATRPAVYRSVLLIDTTGATNLAGTPYETSTRPIAPNGVLEAGIVPVGQVELVNLINPGQLARLGLNIDNAASNAFTLPEKFEALALEPALDPKTPHDAFLFIGSDNDFQTASGMVGGVAFDAGVKAADGSPAGDTDNLILVYRLTLPGWSPTAAR
ncbi:esterase-like activity of phytase family protein [Caulobacter sp.]|uniref:esterase-like activity of phytase family protein n=1 Tax=Caulobacter sp. TaxID=78 RepID=UPI003BA95C6B